MKAIFSKWIERYFSDEEALFLFLLLVFGLVVVATLGKPLAPVISGLIIAFLMQGGVDWLEKKKIPHIISVCIVFSLFISLALALALIVVPLAWKQLLNLFNELPRMLLQVQNLLLELPLRYPDWVSETQIKKIISLASDELTSAGQWVVTYSINSLSSLVTVLIYLVLVPILVFLPEGWQGPRRTVDFSLAQKKGHDDEDLAGNG